MIRIEKFIENDSGVARLHFNGRCVEDVHATDDAAGGKWLLETGDRWLRDLLLSSSIIDLRGQFEALLFPVEDRCHPSLDDCLVGFAKDGRVNFAFGSRYDVDNWKRPYSFTAFCHAIEIAGAAFSECDIDNYAEDGGHFITFRFVAEIPAGRLFDEFDRRGQIVRDVLDDALDDVHSRLSSDSLVAFFRFPEGFEFACGQYLLYFAQFLQDLGIDATTALKQEAHRVMFTVQPASGKEALYWIREALATYLRLPSFPEFRGAPLDGSDIAVTQLRDNIRHLRAQLALARSVIELKDAALDSLVLTNFQYRQLLPGTATPDKSVLVTHGGSERNDSEPLLGTLVSVTKFRIKGLEVDLPALLRMLKRTFKR